MTNREIESQLAGLAARIARLVEEQAHDREAIRSLERRLSAIEELPRIRPRLDSDPTLRPAPQAISPALTEAKVRAAIRAAADELAGTDPHSDYARQRRRHAERGVLVEGPVPPALEPLVETARRHGPVVPYEPQPSCPPPEGPVTAYPG